MNLHNQQMQPHNSDELANIYSHVQVQAIANLAVALLAKLKGNNDTVEFPDFPLKAETTALVVVDVQPEYWENCPEVRKDFPDFPINIARTIQFCRERGVKIIWVRVDYRYDVSPWLTQFERLRGIQNSGEIPCDLASLDRLKWEDFARPIGNEVVILKHSFSSTSNTELLDIFEASNVKTVLVCGLITSICVHHSAFGIFEAGYRTIIIKDACADRGRERHNATIQLYGGYLYDVIQSNDLDHEETGLAPAKLTCSNETPLIPSDGCFGEKTSRTKHLFHL
jgi:nicotinamidase-related amidase